MRLPEINNIDRADKIITKIYDSNQLDWLLQFNEDGDFATLNDVIKRFKIECLRESMGQEQSESNEKYIIFLCSDGSQYYLFFKEIEYEGEKSAVVYGVYKVFNFMSKEEVNCYIQKYIDSKSFDDLAPIEHLNFADPFNEGNLWKLDCYQVRDGVIITQYKISYSPKQYHLDEVSFYSNEDIQNGKLQDLQSCIHLLLPIDKTNP